MNKIYDIIVIGYAKDGQEVIKKLMSANTSLSIACISKKLYGQVDLAGIDFYNDEAIFLNYFRGLISITTANKQDYFCKKLILAINTVAKRYPGLPTNNVYYNGYDIPKDAKNKQAIVIGDIKTAGNLALAVAKRFKYVYLCTKEFTLESDAKEAFKLENTPNIVHLPNCHIVKHKLSKDGTLSEVTLNTFEVLHTSYIFVAADRRPDTDWLPKRIVRVANNGAILTDKNGVTQSVPTIYAVGGCTEDNIKVSKVIKAILGE